ncbi:malignant fibrous histiocytoma-amplified sequence 1-like isoform X1 [Mytilus galloprovincialis]|uniref:malignant fibrous histiocytoma-amplified sequence 1-like isoform X1 n=1 Tax=Mytilus galloprovincialis TaxID=29158 RepID=UPI003F7B9E96
MIKKARFKRTLVENNEKSSNFKSPTRSQSGSKPGSPKARSPRKQSPSPTRKGSAKGSPTRPRSGKSPKRPESGKSPKRPESGKLLKRPESGKSDTKSNKSASPKTIKTSTPKDKKSDLEGKGTKEAAIKKKKTVEIKEPNETEDGLKIKNLSNQGLTRVPGPLLTEKNIGIVNLSANNLSSLPADIKRWTTVRKLDIGKNGLKYGLPKEMEQMVNLQELILAECNMPRIPPVVWQVTSLLVLDISRNKIDFLPPEVGQLINLQKLNLKHTNITGLPPEIALCQELEEVLLWGNTIETLPETLPVLHKLKTLALNYRSFCRKVGDVLEEFLHKGQVPSDSIPEFVFELPALEVLDLEATKINNIPKTENYGLREMNLSCNFLSVLPKNTYNLTRLTVLDLSKNQFSTLPDELGNVRSLVSLKLSHNSLVAIPTTISNLQSLREFFIADNNLKHLPITIKGLKNLITLDVEKNEIKKLPDEICDLTKLSTLNIAKNQIHSLPMHLHNLENLTVAHSYDKLQKYGLWLNGNPLKYPPKEIWRTSEPTKIFDYLKKLAIMKTEHLQRQKLAIIGESQCGKTSFVNGLVHSKSMLTNSESEKTKLVEQTIWKSENMVDFIIYDFSGDPTYKAPSALFLDQKALFILAYDHSTYSIERHQEMIGKWLDYLSLHVPGAVIKLVGLKSDLCRYPGQKEAEEENEETEKDEEDEEENQQKKHEVIEQTKQILLEQVTNHQTRAKDKLLLELQLLGQKINEARGAKDYASDYLSHLEDKRHLVEKLLTNPVNVIQDVSTVSSMDWLVGFKSLVNSLELLVLNSTYFPNAKRYVSDSWTKVSKRIKQQTKHIYLTWEEVTKICQKCDVMGTAVEECMKHLHDIGEILWLKENPKLKNIIFHLPRRFNDIITSLFRHDFDKFFELGEDSKIGNLFVCKGNFSLEKYKEVVSLFQSQGQIPRPLLNCLWFYHNFSSAEYDDLLTLLPLFEMCFSLVEPEVPDGCYYIRPLMVLPWYNKGEIGTDLVEMQSTLTSTNNETLAFEYEFPLTIPDGTFEKLVCVLQDIVKTRTDWKNAVYADLETGQILITRYHDNRSESEHVTILLGGPDKGSVEKSVRQLSEIVTEVLSKVKGLVWRINAPVSLWQNHFIFSGHKE